MRDDDVTFTCLQANTGELGLFFFRTAVERHDVGRDASERVRLRILRAAVLRDVGVVCGASRRSVPLICPPMHRRPPGQPTPERAAPAGRFFIPFSSSVFQIACLKRGARARAPPDRVDTRDTYLMH